jgi:large subunit ribosomal protein L23
MNEFRLIKRPRLTEKSAILKDMHNQVVFVVDRNANKVQIRDLVEKAFKVTVLDVKTVNVRGKTKRVGRFEGRQNNWKKAIITLKEGDKIDYFEGA